MIGFKDVIGSWNTMATVVPRNSFQSSSVNSRQSLPSIINVSALIFVLPYGSNPINELTSTDLPQPDSPTIPKISPGCKEIS